MNKLLRAKPLTDSQRVWLAGLEAEAAELVKRLKVIRSTQRRFRNKQKLHDAKTAMPALAFAAGKPLSQEFIDGMADVHVAAKCAAKEARRGIGAAAAGIRAASPSADSNAFLTPHAVIGVL